MVFWSHFHEGFVRQQHITGNDPDYHISFCNYIFNNLLWHILILPPKYLSHILCGLIATNFQCSFLCYHGDTDTTTPYIELYAHERRIYDITYFTMP